VIFSDFFLTGDGTYLWIGQKTCVVLYSQIALFRVLLGQK